MQQLQQQLQKRDSIAGKTRFHISIPSDLTVGQTQGLNGYVLTDLLNLQPKATKATIKKNLEMLCKNLCLHFKFCQMCTMKTDQMTHDVLSREKGVGLQMAAEVVRP